MRILAHIALLFLLSACAAITPVQTQGSAETSSVTRIPAASPFPTGQTSVSKPVKMDTPLPVAATVLPEATQTTAMPVLTQTSGGLTVQVYSDSDVEVSEPTYLISGRAPAGAVLSINDEIILVDQSQTFSVEVSLEDGPNLIEVVASDTEGNEVSFMITVSFNNQST